MISHAMTKSRIGAILCTMTAVGLLPIATTGAATPRRAISTRHVARSGITVETGLGPPCVFAPPGAGAPSPGCSALTFVPATILIRTTGCHRHWLVKIRSKGVVRRALPPGTYVLVPRPSGKHRFLPGTLRVHVRRGHFTFVYIGFA